MPAVAAFLGITKREVFNLNAAHRMPRPLRIRGGLRWRTAKLDLWRERNYPTRKQWESRRDGRWMPWYLGLPFPPDNAERGEGPPWLIDRSRFRWRRRSSPAPPGSQLGTGATQTVGPERV